MPGRLSWNPDWRQDPNRDHSLPETLGREESDHLGVGNETQELGPVGS